MKKIRMNQDLEVSGVVSGMWRLSEWKLHPEI